MRRTTQELLDEALVLAPAARGEIAARLIDSLDPVRDADSDRCWSDEIARRLSEIESGSVQMIPWSRARAIVRGQADGTAAD